MRSEWLIYRVSRYRNSRVWAKFNNNSNKNNPRNRQSQTNLYLNLKLITPQYKKVNTKTITWISHQIQQTILNIIAKAHLSINTTTTSIPTTVIIETIHHLIPININPCTWQIIMDIDNKASKYFFLFLIGCQCTTKVTILHSNNNKISQTHQHYNLPLTLIPLAHQPATTFHKCTIFYYKFL